MLNLKLHPNLNPFMTLSAQSMSKIWKVSFTLIAIYVPFSLLFVLAERWEWDWIRLVPLFPGLAIYSLIQFPSGLHGPDGALIFTILLLGLSIFGILRMRGAFWPLLAGLFTLSFLFVWTIYAMLKA
jgi:hypothetical protein